MFILSFDDIPYTNHFEDPCAVGAVSLAVTRVPERNSSVPRVATASPTGKSPNTSVNLPSDSPVWTLTHSTFPSRMRTTKIASVVRATADVGTKRVDCTRLTGQRT